MGAKLMTQNEEMIVLSGLTRRYGKKTAVDHLNLKVNRGEVFGLLGPNGAGKTTTILMLLGLTEPDEGYAMIDGIDCTRNAMQVKRITGYLPDSVVSTALTIWSWPASAVSSVYVMKARFAPSTVMCLPVP